MKGEDPPAGDVFSIQEAQRQTPEATVSEESVVRHKPALPKSETANLYQQISEKVTWSIKNNQERIRLNLEPPELGNLYIEIKRERGQVKATFWADNLLTKEILEKNQGILQNALKGSGLQLENYEVFVQKDFGSFQGSDRDRGFYEGEGRGPLTSGREPKWLSPPEILPARSRVAQGNNHIDQWV
jgi:flagellar hook-length control protein FliK